MKHVDIYKRFKAQFPEYNKQIEDWFPNGKNSVRVRVKSGSDFVFTYDDHEDWCFETVESHIRKMKGGTRVAC